MMELQWILRDEINAYNTRSNVSVLFFYMSVVGAESTELKSPKSSANKAIDHVRSMPAVNN